MWHPECNKDNMRKWTAALRSGAYMQGQFHLNKNNEFYCCLGVACEVALQNGLPVAKEKRDYFDSFAYNGVDGALPVVVAEWLGLGAQSNPNVTPEHLAIHANDSLRMTFAQIADAIDKYYGLVDYVSE